jgi:hypothetical protein
VRSRPDLKGEPFGMRMPIVVRVAFDIRIVSHDRGLGGEVVRQFEFLKN